MSDILTKSVISREDCIFCARHNCTPIANKMIVATCDALAAAEQRATESDARAERLHEALSHLVNNKPPNGKCPYCIGHLEHQPHCPMGKALAVLAETMDGAAKENV